MPKSGGGGFCDKEKFLERVSQSFSNPVILEQEGPKFYLPTSQRARSNSLSHFPETLGQEGEANLAWCQRLLLHHFICPITTRHVL